MRTREAGRAVAIAVLLALAAGACGGGTGGQGDPTAVGDGQGQGPGNPARSAVAVRPDAPFDASTPSDEGGDGGRNLPGPVFFDVGGRCFADLRAGSYDAVAARMTSVIESAGAGTDRRLLALAYTCRGVALLNEGALLEAARDLDQAEGRLGALPRDSGHQVDLLLLRAQMVASAQRQEPQRAGAYLGRAVALAPEQAAGLRQELRAASAGPTGTTTAEPPTSGAAETTGATGGSAGPPSTTGPAGAPVPPTSAG
jgi:hypothetical protein